MSADPGQTPELHSGTAIPGAAIHGAAMSGAAMSGAAVRSPNIWDHPEVYEIENRAVDRAGLIEAAMSRIHDRRGTHVLDIGCGTGFHLPRWAAEAAHVSGVEPHAPLREQAQQRVDALDPAVAERIRVLPGTAQELPLPEASVEVAHARWAYFFGPGCEPGLAELDRVMAPGGTAFVVDNDVTTSTFGSWFRRSHPSYDHAGITRFWRRSGWTREPLLIAWEMESRADLEAVVRIEFAPEFAEAFLAEHTGTVVDYAVDLWWKRF